MKVNSIVFNEYHGIRRYGVVREVQTKQDGWKYAKVAWVNDDRYERAMHELDELRNNQNYLVEYRTDQLKQIDAAAEQKAIDMCLIMSQSDVNEGDQGDGHVNQKLEKL